MTVEEIEIIVTAKVEEAIKEFKKIAPTVIKAVKQAQEALEKVDTKAVTNKINQAVQFVKKKLENLKKSNANNEIAIKVNSKEAQKQISQIQKEIDSLQQKINSRQMKLNITNDTLDKIRAETNQAVIKEMPEAGNKGIKKETYTRLDNNVNYNSLVKESDKLNNEIIKYNSLLDTAKSRMSGLKQETTQTSSSQNKLTTYFSGFKGKIEQAKIGIDAIRNLFSKMPNITKLITNHIKKMGTGIKTGLGHVLKYAGTLVSLRGIYSTLSNSASAWLSSQNSGAQQLSANIEYMKYAMGSVFAPVIEYVVNLIYQLMKAIQSVVYAFSGINIFAKATAKSMGKTVESAKQASKSLAGVHNEINNVSENDNSGGGSGSISPSMDLSQVDTQMNSFAQKLYDFFAPLKESWDNYGQGLIEQVKITASQIGSLIVSVWGSFEKIITNGTVYTTLELILAIIGNIAEAFANAWNYNGNGDVIVQNLANAFNNLLIAINNVVQSEWFQNWLNWCSGKFKEISDKLASINWQPLIDALAQIGTTVGTIALDILSGLTDIFKWFVENPIVAEILLAIAVAIETVVIAFKAYNIVMGIVAAVTALAETSMLPIIVAIVAVIAIIILCITHFEELKTVLNDTFSKFTEVYNEYIAPFVEKMKEDLATLWNEHIKPLLDNIKDLLLILWEDVLKSLIDWFIENIIPVLVPIFESIWNTLSKVFGDIIDIIGGVIETFKGIIEFIVGVFTGDWEKAWQGIKDFFSGIWDIIKGVVSAVWNTISGIISTAINIIKGYISTTFNSIAITISTIWNGIWSTIKGVINSILGGIEGMANGIVNGINVVIRALNKLKFDIPDWIPGLGGKSFGFNIGLIPQVSLPRLAKGNVAYSPLIAQFGEYAGASHNPEITTPQNILRETFDEVLSDHEWNNNSSNSTMQLAVYVGNKKLGEILLDDLRDKKRQTGQGIEVLVGG